MMKLKDNSKRARLIINVFWGLCILNFIAIISTYFENELLERIKIGATFSMQEAESNDSRQAIIGLCQMVVYITSLVLFLNWFRRAYGNLHRIGIKTLKYSETMAVWSFFIPIINFYRPYKIAKEIATGTIGKLNELNPHNKANSKVIIIGLWWILTIINYFLVQLYVRRYSDNLLLDNYTIHDLIEINQLLMLSDFFDIVVTIVTILMIKHISKYESLLFNIAKNFTSKDYGVLTSDRTADPIQETP